MHNVKVINRNNGDNCIILIDQHTSQEPYNATHLRVACLTPPPHDGVGDGEGETRVLGRHVRVVAEVPRRVSGAQAHSAADDAGEGGLGCHAWDTDKAWHTAWHTA